MHDPTWGRRYERVLGALLCLCGAKLRAELEKQTHLVTLLGAVAERVRQASGSTRQVSAAVIWFQKEQECLGVITSVCVCVQVALQEGLENIQNFFQRNSCRLPLNPSLVAKELNIKVTCPE